VASTEWFDFIARYSGTDGVQSVNMTTNKLRVRNKEAVRITAAEFAAGVPSQKEAGRRARSVGNNIAVVALFACMLISDGLNFEGEGGWEA
jgi:hypothetical protein